MSLVLFLSCIIGNRWQGCNLAERRNTPKPTLKVFLEKFQTEPISLEMCCRVRSVTVLRVSGIVIDTKCGLVSGAVYVLFLHLVLLWLYS